MGRFGAPSSKRHLAPEVRPRNAFGLEAAAASPTTSGAAASPQSIARSVCFPNHSFRIARQRPLPHIAALACPREIQFLSHCKEIMDLVHFHDDFSFAFCDSPDCVRQRLITCYISSNRLEQAQNNLSRAL
jgi:hypothetical protein